MTLRVMSAVVSVTLEFASCYTSVMICLIRAAGRLSLLQMNKLLIANYQQICLQVKAN